MFGKVALTRSFNSILFRRFYTVSLARVLRWVAQAYQYIHTLVNTRGQGLLHSQTPLMLHDQAQEVAAD